MPMAAATNSQTFTIESSFERTATLSVRFPVVFRLLCGSPDASGRSYAARSLRRVVILRRPWLPSEAASTARETFRGTIHDSTADAARDQVSLELREVLRETIHDSKP